MSSAAIATLVAEFRKLRERAVASLVWTPDNRSAYLRTSSLTCPVAIIGVGPVYDSDGQHRNGTWTAVLSLTAQHATNSLRDIYTLGGREAVNAIPGEVVFVDPLPPPTNPGRDIGLAGEVHRLFTEAGRVVLPASVHNPFAAWCQFVLTRSPNHLKPFPRVSSEFPRMESFWSGLRTARPDQVDHIRWLEDAGLRSIELFEAAPPVEPFPVPAPPPAANPAAIDPKVRNWLVAHFLSDPNPERIDGKPTAAVRFEAFRDMLLDGGFDVLATADACVAAGWTTDLSVNVAEREEGDDGPSSPLGDALAARLGLTPGEHRIVGIYGTVCHRPTDAKPVPPPPPPEPLKPEPPKWDSLSGFLTVRGVSKKVRKNGHLIRTILDAFERAKWPQGAVRVSALAGTDDQKKSIERFLEIFPMEIRPDGTGAGLVWRWKQAE